ncbi:MAG: tetratricopeptide repeat protein [Spirochaetota bacterium]
MNHLLSSHVSANPDDPYNGYYLFLIGRDYQRSGDHEFARRYFRHALNEYPDVNINGDSVHFSVLEALAEITEDPRERIVYYEDLLERFPDRTNEAELHYYMGRTYEDLVDWPRSEEAYRAFLEAPTDIPGASNAEARVERKLQFANSSRSWTFRNLDDLVDILRRALRNRDVRTLEEHQSDVQFFAASPRQDPLDANSTFGFDIGVFLNRSNVQVADEFSMRSNEREAYLQTTGWAERFSTWYFYFRRIDFPADPEVHGNWEWAGIRFGEVN